MKITRKALRLLSMLGTIIALTLPSYAIQSIDDLIDSVSTDPCAAEQYDEDNEKHDKKQSGSSSDSLDNKDYSVDADDEDAIAVLVLNNESTTQYYLLSMSATSDAGSAYGIYIEGGGILGVHGCDISAESTDGTAVGIYALNVSIVVEGLGELSDGFTDNTIDVSSQYGDAYGICLAGSEVTLAELYGHDITVYSGEGDAYGIYTEGLIRGFGISHASINVTVDSNGSAYGIVFANDHKWDYEDYEKYDMSVYEESTIAVTVNEGTGNAIGIASLYYQNSASIIYTDIKTYSDEGYSIGVYLDQTVFYSSEYDINGLETFDHVSIDAYSEQGRAIGVFLVPDSEIVSGIVTMNDIDMTITAHGDIYGYALTENGISSISGDNYGGIAFYNSGTDDSTQVVIGYNADGEEVAISYSTVTLTLTSLGASETFNGDTVYGVVLGAQEITDLAFESITMESPSGDIYALYADNSTISTYGLLNEDGDFSVYDGAKTEVTLTTSGSIACAAYLNNTTVTGELSGDYTFYINDWTADYDEGSTATIYGAYLSNSHVETLSADFTINASNANIYAVYLDADSTLGSYSGTIYLADGDYAGYCYVVNIGGTLDTDDSIIFYNAATGDSSGITVTADTYVASHYANFWGCICGVSMTGSDSSYVLDFDIYLEQDGQALDLSDGANLTISSTGSIGVGMGRDSTVTGSGTVLNIDGGILSNGDWSLNVSDGASLIGNAGAITGELHLTGSGTTATLTDFTFDEGYITMSDGASLTINGSFLIDVYHSNSIKAEDENTTITINSDSIITGAIALEDGATLSVASNTSSIIIDSSYSTVAGLSFTDTSHTVISFDLSVYGADSAIQTNSDEVLYFTNGVTISNIDGDYDSTQSKSSTSSYLTVLKNHWSDLNISGDSSTITFNGDVDVTDSFTLMDGNFVFNSQSWSADSINLGYQDTTTGAVSCASVEFTNNITIATNAITLYIASASDYSTLSVADGFSITFNDVSEISINLVLADKFYYEEGFILALSELDLSDLVDAEISYYINGESLDEELYTLTIGSDGLSIQFLSDATLQASDYHTLATTGNGMAGALLLDEYNIFNYAPTGGDLANILDSMDSASGAQADNLAAAIAGASVTALGSAQGQEVSRNLSNLRKRAQSGQARSDKGQETELSYNAWITGEGGYSHLSNDGTSVGHTLSTWGASLGCDWAFADKGIVGLAFGRTYGDLSTDGVDAAEGDFDTNHISLYMNYELKAWTHTLATSLGLSDADLTRNIQHENGSYKSRGKTDGTAFGVSYEISRSYSLKEGGESRIKPLASISYIYGQIDGYSETGSDASLIVGDQENNYVKLALGAQVDGLLSNNILGRKMMGRASVALSADLGDRASSAAVSLSQYNGVSQSVEGSEYGVMGIEFGAGISIPSESINGAFFAELNCEFRSEMSNVHAAMGYQFAF